MLKNDCGTSSGNSKTENSMDVPTIGNIVTSCLSMILESFKTGLCNAAFSLASPKTWVKANSLSWFTAYQCDKFRHSFLWFYKKCKISSRWKLSIFCSLFPSDKIETLRFVRIFRLVLIIEYWHACATMLCRQKVSLQEIQLWLGHSTYQTTADIYTHLDYKDKIGTASAAEKIVTKAVKIW